MNHPDAPSSTFHLVLRGRLRAYILGPDGRHLLLELIETGGFDGILPATGHRGHFTEVIEDARLVSMELRTLERLTRADNQIGTNLLRLITTRLEQREEHLETIALHGPRARLVRRLLALAQAFGTARGGWTVLDRRLTHQMIADMLGVRRETVTLHMRQLAELGAVKFEGGRYWLNRELLQLFGDAAHTDAEALTAGPPRPAPRVTDTVHVPASTDRPRRRLPTN